MNRRFTVKLLRFVPGFIKKDFGRKVIALVLTFLIYIAVMERTGQTREIRDVEIRCVLPPPYVNIGENNPTTRITVEGPERALKNLTQNDFYVNAHFDESQFKAGQTSYFVPIRPSDVVMERGFMIKVTNVDASSAPFEIDKMVRKEIPIEPTYSPDSRLPAGYRVGKVTFATPRVIMEGPESLLANISVIRTEVIPLENSVQNFQKTVDLRTPNQAITITPSRVMVNVEIIKDFDTRTLTRLPIRLLYDPSTNKKFSVNMETTKVDVTVEGNKNFVDGITADILKPYIDVSMINEPGVYKFNVNCWADSDELKITNIQPASVQVKIVNESENVSSAERQ